MPQGLAALRQRKKELLLESDINRQIVRVELCQLQIKIAEWRENLLKIRNASKWIAPLAGVSLGVYSVGKKLRGNSEDKRNGRGNGKAGYLKLLVPIVFPVLRKAYSFWRHAQKRNGHTDGTA